MDQNILVSDYHLLHFCYQTVFSAGPDLFFLNPFVAYIKKGYAKFLYKGQTFYAYEGDLIYIAYETRYQSIWYGSPDVEWYSVSFDFHSKYAFYHYRFQILKNYPAELFEKMYQAYEDAPLKSVSYFYQLLDDIFRKLQSSSLPGAYSAVQPAVEYIEKNYQAPFSVRQLSELCHISESGFFKLFKEATGVTPIAYKHNIMIQHAISLISNTSMSIEEISTAVGFPSSNYFRKVFARFTDKTPKELRRTHRDPNT